MAQGIEGTNANARHESEGQRNAGWSKQAFAQFRPKSVQITRYSERALSTLTHLPSSNCGTLIKLKRLVLRLRWASSSMMMMMRSQILMSLQVLSSYRLLQLVSLCKMSCLPLTRRRSSRQTRKKTVLVTVVFENTGFSMAAPLIRNHVVLPAPMPRRACRKIFLAALPATLGSL